MGMFDWIEPIECPSCGQRTLGMQSKCGPCGLGMLRPSEVEGLYGDCEGCGAWLEFHAVREDEKIVVLDGKAFHVRITEKGK